MEEYDERVLVYASHGWSADQVLEQKGPPEHDDDRFPKSRPELWVQHSVPTPHAPKEANALHHVHPDPRRVFDPQRKTIDERNRKLPEELSFFLIKKWKEEAYGHRETL